MRALFFILFCTSLSLYAQQNQDSTKLVLVKTIYGKINPKSIVHNGEDLFFAQNMMYKHTITVYNRDYELVKTISDKVDLNMCGFEEGKGKHQGSPVEAVPVEGGKFMWVSNYQMYGQGYNKPGCDACVGKNYDSSYVFKINTTTFEIEAMVKAGSIPKYMAATPDNRYILVSNWSSGDVSVIDNYFFKEIKRIDLGMFPRGIAIDSKGEKAYVAIMGGTDIAIINLKNDYEVSWIRGVGKKPRHLCIDSEDKYLYVTLNSENKVGKIDLSTNKMIAKVGTGSTPRSMVISDDDKYLYAVNYHGASMSKISTLDMKVLQTVKTNSKPIGITYDPKKKEVWASCYSGSIHVYRETPIEEKVIEQPVIPAHDGKEGFHIIVGSYGVKGNADRHYKKLKEGGYKAEILKSVEGFYRVSIMSNSSESEALKDIRTIRKGYSNAWLLIN